MENNVQVAVRCRPVNEREKSANRGPVVQCKQATNEITVIKRKTYSFDKVYGQYSEQKDLFKNTVKPVVDESLTGYNCTIFAYGQTGTGKTYTMLGNLAPEHKNAGIIPRAVQYIFETLQSTQQEYSVKVSFLQLYNEELKDLLEPESAKRIRIVEDAKKGTQCQNLLEVTTQTAGQVFELLETGVKNRITSETLMNENSSRSHSIFTIKIHSKEYNPAGEDILKTGQLNLVDLAGSECIGRSGARNARAREAGNINQSLLTLGRVITALVDNHPHVPYRDSKLTRLLQDSLGGRAKTTIVATLAPCADSIDETLSTLDYAHRARNIKNKPEVLQRISKRTYLKEIDNELEMLRNALSAQRQKDGIFLPPAQFSEMQERIASQAAQLSELEDELENKTKSLKEMEEEVQTKRLEMEEMKEEQEKIQEEMERQSNELKETACKLNQTQEKLDLTQDRLNKYQQNETILLDKSRLASGLYNDKVQEVKLLNEKIQRQQKVLMSNDQEIKVFETLSKQKFNLYTQNIQKHQEEHEQNVQEMTNCLDLFVEIHTKNIQEMMAFIQEKLYEQVKNQLISKIQTNFKDQLVRLSTHQTTLDTLCKEQALNTSNLLDTWTKEAHHQLNQLIEEMSKRQQKTFTMCSLVKDKLTSSLKETQTFCDLQRQQLEALKSQMNESIVVQSIQLTQHETNLQASLKTNQEQMANEMKEMKLKMMQYMENCMQKQMENLQIQTKMITKEMTNQQNNLQSMKQSVDKHIETSVDSLSQWQNTNQVTNQEISEQVDQVVHSAEVSNEEQSNAVNKFSKKMVDSFVNKSKEKSKKFNDALDQVTTAYASQEQEFDKTQQEQVSTFEQTFDANQDQVNSKCESISRDLDEQMSNTRDKMSMALDMTQVVLKDARTETNQYEFELDQYVINRQVNESTGHTPNSKSKKKNMPVFPVFEATVLDDEQGDDVTETNQDDSEEIQLQKYNASMQEEEQPEDAENMEDQEDTNDPEEQEQELQNPTKRRSGSNEPLKRSRNEGITISTKSTGGLLPPKKYRVSPPASGIPTASSRFK